MEHHQCEADLRLLPAALQLGLHVGLSWKEAKTAEVEKMVLQTEMYYTDLETVTLHKDASVTTLL